jgi:hypothetical protein
MVSKLKHRATDPNFRHGPEKYRVVADRGAGWYYHRGNGQYSRYDQALDAKRLPNSKKQTNVQSVSDAEKGSPHKADYKIGRRPFRKTHRQGGTGMKGYY